VRAIVRDPRAVRRWPQQQMPGFAPNAVPDSHLDAVVAYLQQAAHRTPAPAATNR
jgi:mono/diheme cytochrome c family protein